MTLRTSLRGYLADIAQAFDRAPVECALTLATAVLISYTIEHENISNDTVRVVIAVGLTFAFTWGGTLLEGLGAIARAQRWAATFAGLLVGSAYLLVVGDIDRQAEAWRAFMLVGGLLLLLIALPAWIRNDADASLRLRRVNGRIALRTLTIGLYGLALFAGLALAIASVDKLFELKLRGNLYGHVYVWIMVVLVPWVIVGGLNDYVRPVSEPTDLVRVIARFNPALLFPQLAAIYYIILCAYAMRIAITGELPQNLVSPLVIAAGGLAALALVVFDPDVSADWSMRWLRYTPVVFLPLGVLGVWALTARIEAYGWTEFRLLRMAALITLMAMAALAAVQLIRRRRFALRVLPLVPGAVLVIGAVGPWGVPALARRDQQQHLRNALARAHVDLAQVPPAADTTRRIVAASLFDEIASTSRYLTQHFGDDALTAVLPASARNKALPDLAAYYHLSPGLRTNQRAGFWSSTLPPGSTVRLSDGAVTYRVEFPQRGQVQTTRLSHDTLYTAAGTDTLAVPLNSLFRASTQSADRRPATLDPAAAVLHPISKQGKTADLLVLDANVRVENGKYSLLHLSGLLIVHP